MSLKPWLYLTGAVCAEIVGVTVMKLVADEGSLLILLFMYAMIGLSFYLLSIVVLYLPLGLSYALWEAGGIISVTLIGFFLFHEQLGVEKLLGMAMLLTGVVIIKLAMQEPDADCIEAEAGGMQNG